MQISTRIATPETEYQNVTLRELISIYEHAYSAQNFHVYAKTERMMPEGNRIARLVLDIANPAHPTRKKAQLSFQFYSPDKAGCTPCSVTREMFTVGAHDEYSSEEWSAFQQQLIAADKRALDEVKHKLGKSIPPLEEQARPSTP